jgi:hypothetical protein
MITTVIIIIIIIILELYISRLSSVRVNLRDAAVFAVKPTFWFLVLSFKLTHDIGHDHLILRASIIWCRCDRTANKIDIDHRRCVHGRAATFLEILVKMILVVVNCLQTRKGISKEKE